MTGLLAAPKRLCASRRAHMMYREVLAICSLQRNGPEFGVGAVECWNNAELIESASSQIMVNQAFISGAGSARPGPTRRPRRVPRRPCLATRGACIFAKTWQRPPTPKELRGLVDSYVKEEIYYREAIKLGLDRDDTLIRSYDGLHCNLCRGRTEEEGVEALNALTKSLKVHCPSELFQGSSRSHG